MSAPFAAAHAVQTLGLVAITVLIAGWLLAGSERLRWSCAIGVLALAPLVLASSVIGDKDSSLPELSPAFIAAGGIAGVVAVAVVAAIFVRWPRAILPAALATLAFRVPLEIGGDSVKLLLPLYLTLAGAVVSHAWLTWRGRKVDAPRAPKLLDLTIVIYLALYALQSAWSGDPAVATQNFCFFYAPFALLYGLAATQKWDARLLRASVVALVAVALVLVFAGYVEFARGQYLITIGGSQPSDFDPYFRVQSLFFDPNIYGRFLAVVMLVVAAIMLWTARTKRIVACAVVLALLWAGLVISLSQTSFAALLAGLVALACMRWRAKPILIATGVVLVAGVAFALAFPSVTGVNLTSSQDAETSTSGRFDLITGGATLWSEKPIFGYGSGDFSNAYKSHDLAKSTPFGSNVTTKSHTAPLTVAAEQGIIGFAAFVALLIAGFGAVFRRVGDSSRPGQVARVAVAAAFTAVFVHTLAYAAFLEDPLTWVLLGCAVSLAAIPRTDGGGAGSADADLDTESA